LAKFRFFATILSERCAVFQAASAAVGPAKMLLFPRTCSPLTSRPTTLDIPARETLEHALDGYEGNPHWWSARSLLSDRVLPAPAGVSRMAPWRAHLGNYSDWRAYRQSQAAARQCCSAVPSHPVINAKSPVPRRRTASAHSADLNAWSSRWRRKSRASKPSFRRCASNSPLTTGATAEAACAGRPRTRAGRPPRPTHGRLEKASAELQKFLEDARTG